MSIEITSIQFGSIYHTLNAGRTSLELFIYKRFLKIMLLKHLFLLETENKSFHYKSSHTKWREARQKLEQLHNKQTIKHICITYENQKPYIKHMINN